MDGTNKDRASKVKVCRVKVMERGQPFFGRSILVTILGAMFAIPSFSQPKPSLGAAAQASAHVEILPSSSIQGLLETTVRLQKEEGYPWPWAVQCPLEWSHIKGKWTDVQGARIFEFLVQSKPNWPKMKYITINEYKLGPSGLQERVATGFSLSEDGETYLKVKMEMIVPDLQGNFEEYWLYMGSFVEGTHITECKRASALRAAIRLVPYDPGDRKSQIRDEVTIINRSDFAEEIRP